MNSKCPYCGGDVVLTDSSIIYGTSYGKIWICFNWPKCDAYVGCHKGTNQPLGTLANKQLRHFRNCGHASFDRLWHQRLFKSRLAAYKWLAQQLGLKREKTHFAMFDEQTVLRAIDICDSYYKEHKRF